MGPEVRRGRRVLLAAPTAACGDEYIALTRRSASLHRPWVEPASGPAAFRDYLDRNVTGRTVGLLVRLIADRRLVGVVNLNDPVMGVFRSVYLGYFVDAAHAGRGYMREGLALALDHAFLDLGLHRAEANIQPENERSKGLVAGLGFRREGTSKGYLYIAGQWRDHERWAITAEEWRSEPVLAL